MRDLSKYYTPPEVAEYCVLKAKEVLKDRVLIKEWLEPSAGEGVFLDYLDAPYTALDLEPDDPRVMKMDYFDYSVPYSLNRVVIGNPPFNDANLCKNFIKHSFDLAPFVCFILPKSYYRHNLPAHNNVFLAYSELLGPVNFGGAVVDVCFNIYIYMGSTDQS